MNVTRDKNCFCHACAMDFHYLGIAKHRRAHLDKGETVKITYTHGDTYTHTPGNTPGQYHHGMTR